MSAIMGMIAKKFPVVQQIQRTATHPTKSLEELRSEIWKIRTEYWYRRVSGFPETVGQARKDVVDIYQTKLKNPQSWTFGDLAAVGIVGVQVVGAFCVGEVVGRGKLTGYDSGDSHGH